MKKVLFLIREIQFYSNKTTIFLMLFFISLQTFSQRPVTSVVTTLSPATPSSYTEAGQLYEWGQGNDIVLESFSYNGETYFLDNTFTQTSYKLVRVNGNGGVSYDRFGIYAERELAGTSFSYNPTLPSPLSMATLLGEPILNRGANDVFKNATVTAQNIERIDVLYAPFKVPNLPNLDKVGFLATEKDGNSTYKAAVVTSIDISGNPLTFGPLITIQNGDYGTVIGDTPFELLVNNSAGGNPVNVGFNNQNVGVSFISLSDLGIGVNDIVYGISFFDSNVDNSYDLLDPSTFPNATGGGADIHGGLGAIVTSIGTVSGTVYADINGNGTQDANEPGIKNISVTILGSDGGYQTVITGEDGGYSGFVTGGSTTVTVDETDPNSPPNHTRTEGTSPTIVTAIEGEDVNIGNNGYTSDNDNDGVIDLDDVDDDNDGILDTIELTDADGVTIYDPLGDEDGDKIVNYLDTNDDNLSTDGSTTSYVTTGSGGIPDKFDFDDDGIPNHLDLDSDNDGIPDNIEAQTTNGYIATSGAPGAGFTDVDNDGLDDKYDPVVAGGTPGTAITPVNSDSAIVTDNPDYLDLNSDEDATSDTIEANLSLSGIVGLNGLDNFYDNGDNYTDVNGSFDNTQADNFPDAGNNANLGLPNDVDWRDILVLGEIDTDNDGVPNSVDIDDDNDGILDTDEDANTDADNNPATNPTDTDGDGIPNYLDLDADNDGIPDNIEGQVTDSVGGLVYIAPTGIVGFNGLDNAYENNDTLIATSYTLINTDSGTDAIPDYLDLDSDNDGTSDRVEANLSLSGDFGANGLDANYDNGDNYTDVNGNFDNSQTDNFPDADADVNDGVGDDTGDVDYRDFDSVFSDNDNDGIPDTTDLDDDNDGILDTDEGLIGGACPPEYNGTVVFESGIVDSANLTGAPDGNFAQVNTNGNNFTIDFSSVYTAGTQYQITWKRKTGVTTGTAIIDLSESSDNSSFTAHPGPPSSSNSAVFQTVTITSNVNFRYLNFNKGTGSTVDYEVDAIAILPVGACPLDTDGDGFPNYLDLDSDNDGIPDNIEAQTTQGYGPPDGVLDVNGVDTAYIGGLTPVDTDSDGTPDYIETDSDNDGLLDNIEAGLTLTGVYGNNGLDNAYDNGDNYIDVNGSFDNSQTDNFPDLDYDVFNTGDVDYRDDTFTIDIDQDGIPNEDDLDDDNDGILDTEEGRLPLITAGNFDDLITPSFGDNTGVSIAPWILESGSGTNVIKVDGTGGSNYGTGGPEFDADGNDGNYFTVNGSAGVIYQTFTLTETTIVDYGGSISARDGNISEAKMSIFSGTGSGGTELSSTGTKITSANKTWRKIANSVSLPAGTYSLVVELDEDINFDEAFAFSNIDSDGDGIVNQFDLDADNDGIPDNIEAQTTAGYIAPSASYSLTGIDLSYGAGLTPVNTDGTDNPDYLDLDSDNEGGFDIVESGAGLTDANTDGVADGAPSVFGNNGLIDSLETGDADLGYTDVNGEYDETFKTIFTDTDNDVNIGGDLDYRDDIVGIDTDNDGFVNSIDIDDDNDGIPDINESGGNDPDGDEDNDGILNYLDTADGGDGGPGGTTNYTDTDGNGVPDVYDFDGDGVPNHLDIDADNDGIPDNVEAQTTTGYVPPATVGDTDTDNDGLNDAYDSDCAPCGAITGVDLSSPNNHDLVDNPDYLDTDSDNDGKLDIVENHVSNGLDTVLDENTGISTDGTPDGIIDPLNFVDSDGDGLADVFEGANVNDGYDVNDEINTPQSNLPDVDSDVLTTGDVDFRDNAPGIVSPGVAGNILWLRADLGVTEASDEVTSWIDQTASAHNATSVTGEAPDRLDAGAGLLNFNPVIDFDGTNQDLIIGTNNTATPPGGIYGTATYSNIWSYVVFKPETLQNSFVYLENVSGGNSHVKMPDVTQFRQRLGASGTQQPVTNPAGFLNNYGLYTLGTTSGTGPTGNRQAIHKEGAVVGIANPTFASVTGLDREMDIGSNGGSRHLDGQIAEIMIFNETPTALKQQQVESYLAIKYGLTLSSTSYSASIVEGDYILQDQSTKVWDFTANADYHFDVAGIGRDDAMVLNQKQSKSVGVSSDAIITIGLDAIAATNLANANTFTTNKDFLVWGNNNGTIASITETELICAPEKTIGRTWKIIENGNVGDTQIAADKTLILAALNTANTVKVFKVADDAAFTTNVEYIPVVETATHLEVDYNFNGTKYFTYSEINGIFWNGNSSTWSGGNSVAVTGGPSTNIADVNKVMIIDSESSLTHATLTESTQIECVWVKTNSKLMVGSDYYLEFDEDFILDGEIKLIGDGQLIQTHTGLSNVQGNGKLYKDQAAIVPSIYRYHYWSSPVRELNLDSFRINKVMKDGNIATSSTSKVREIDWTGEGNIYDGATATPPEAIKIAPYWIYTYLNGTTQANYVHKYETGVLARGQGFTMKSTGQTPQNFTFVGTPNDGSITFNLDAGASSLYGNPYPSALDVTDFINTNIDSMDGTLYFWEHTGEDSVVPSGSEGHNLTGYQGGYSQRNISMGIAANGVAAIPPLNFDWETASDNGANITQTIEDITATVTLSSGDIGLEDISLIINPTDNAVINEAGESTFTMTVSFNHAVDIQSIEIYNDILGIVPQNVTITPNGAGNSSISAILTNTLSLIIDETVSVSWGDVTSFTISGDSDFDIGLNDIKLTKGNAPSLGLSDYHPPTRYMAVGQGFFVSSSLTGGEVRFENSQRAYKNNDYGIDGSNGGTYFFKGNSNQEDKEPLDLLPVLKLGFNHTGANQVKLHRQIGISFRSTNTFKYDNGYDSEVFDVGATDFYWNFVEDSDKKLIIAGVSQITNQLEVPLVITTNTKEPIFVEIDEIRNIIKPVYLLDKLTNTYYELSKKDMIELNLEEGNYTDRFYLTFNKNENTLSTDNTILNKELTVFMDNKANEIVIHNLDALIIQKVELFNILGQQVKEWKTIEKIKKNSLKVKNLSATVYIVKIQTDKGKLTRKILIE